MALRRAVRWWLWIGLAGIGLFAVAGVCSPLWCRPLVELRASEVLARPVTIGHLRLRPGSPLVISAENVVIGNPPDFPAGNEPFARVPLLTLRLDAVASLRQRKVVITSIEVERPVVHVVGTKDGRENYHLHAIAGAGVSARLLKVLDGRALISLAAQSTDFEASFAAEPTANEAVGTRLTAAARGTYAGQPLVAQFEGGVPLDRDDARWPVNLDVQNGPTRVSVKGTLEGPLRLRSATVNLQLAGPDMTMLTPLTDVPFPVTPPYELHGKLDYAAGLYRFTEAAGRIGRSDVTGMMTVAARAGGRPEITAELLSHSLALTDIESLLSGQMVAAGTPGQTAQQHAQTLRMEAQARANPRVLPQAPLHLPKLERADIHLTYRAERIQGATMPFDDLTLHMDVADGVVTLHPLSFGVGKGRLSGDVSLTPQKDVVRARADIRLAQLDISHLMRASGGFHGAGVLNGTARLEGVGHSMAEILGSADGAVSLRMAGGNLSSWLVDLVGLRLGSALLSWLGPSRDTRVQCFVGDLALRQGVLAIRTLRLKTEDAVTEGYGAIDLGREQVDVQLRTASRHLTIGVLPAPLLVNGTLKDPHAAPATREGLIGALAMLPMIQSGSGDGPGCDNTSNRSGG